MSAFDVSATAYDRFMGRYSRQLSPQLADLAGVEAGQSALDVGCGPGALTAELVERLGPAAVCAVDPSASFVDAMRERFPGLTVERAPAERLPFDDDSFDAALAQLVVPFMSDAVAGLREMARVTVTGGVVAACGWDLAGDRSPLTAFWSGVHEVMPGARDEAGMRGSGEGQLPEVFAAAGIGEVREVAMPVEVEHASFEDWWEPYTFGVGPAGAFVGRLDPSTRERVREACREQLGDGPFTIAARAWTATGIA
jgi:SAM-dependent methyltransferase